ncbi:hypothetical protein ACJJI5_09430 [Microbulbifer sp. EKSA008]|uniref:hypothetical protein n=1 Tax=unclassified Microbulbifer TaxID=2619833 RepID=UPI0024AE69F6|nr:hypothetical protein [Microbulbifer sp. VAAF005]WHI47758.1 hypothetical protein P0078_05015 [Microbulbifer sp. VAAF005]
MVNFEQRNTKGNALSEMALEGNDREFDAWLSEQLQFNEPHLDNDGFCDRVMAALPAQPKRSKRRSSYSQYIAVAAALGIIAWQFPFSEVVAEMAKQSISLYSLVGVGLLSSLAVMTGGIFAARR